jgi:hypothetical protein
MPRWHAAAACLLLCIFQPSAWAATVSRCEDPQGRITFTSHGCPSQHSERPQTATNPPPGGGKAVIPMTGKPARTKQTAEGIRFASTGQRDDGCGNSLTALQKRQAIIRQAPRPGMTRKDVESALGRPDRTSQQNGQMRYHYKDHKGNTRQVSFDEHGCVKGKH